MEQPKERSFSGKGINLPLVMLILSLLTSFTSNIYSQNIISRKASDYPGGSLSSSCSSTPYTGCIITLPPAKYEEDYSFTIPLKTGITRSDISFIFTQTSNCSEGAISFTADGKVEMNAASSCRPEINNFIEIDLETINNTDGTLDQQKYYLPILRDPIKVVLVLDMSGSMSLPVPGGAEVRWEVLKKAVYLFTKKFEKFNQEGDSISVIYYSKDTIMPHEPIGSKFIAITPEDFTPVNLKSSEVIKTDMVNRTPQDSAAMGKALLLAKAKLVNSDATKIVMLFTDGFQNVKPLITKFGNKLNSGEFLSNGPCNKPDSVRYYTIGMGDITTVPEILGEIAHANGGVALTTTTGNDEGDFYNFFQDQFDDLIRGIGQPVDTRINDLAPFDDTLNVPVSAKLELSFNESIYTNTGFIKIKRSKDDTDFELIDVTSGQVSGSGSKRITISPSTNFESNTDYYVLVDYTAFRNVKIVNYSGISSKTFWNFTTKDIISPDVLISTSAINPTNSNPFEVTVVFSERISRFKVENVSVVNGIAGELNTSDSITFKANIHPTADGLVSVKVNPNVAFDLAGNLNSQSNTLSINYDATRPSVSFSTLVKNPTNTNPFEVTVVFSERISRFKVENVSVVNGIAGELNTSDSITFKANIHSTTDGFVSVKVNPNVAFDLAGNLNTQSNTLTINFDATRPSVSLSTLVKNPTNSNPFEVAIVFSERITRFKVDKISVVNGIAGELNTSDSITFKANIHPTTDGFVSVKVNPNVALDLAGNLNILSNTITINFDATRPSVYLSANNNTTIPQFNAQVKFSERIIGFKVSEIIVTNGMMNNLSTTDSINYAAIITSTTPGVVKVNINENQVVDSAGNYNFAAQELVVSYIVPNSAEILKNEGILIYTDNGFLIVEFLKPNTLNFQSAYIEIYSLNGSLIKKEKIGRNTLFKTYLNDKQEIYLVKLTLDKSIYHAKISNW